MEPRQKPAWRAGGCELGYIGRRRTTNQRARYAYVFKCKPGGSRLGYALALTRPRRVRFLAFTLAR